MFDFGGCGSPQPPKTPEIKQVSGVSYFSPDSAAMVHFVFWDSRRPAPFARVSPMSVVMVATIALRSSEARAWALMTAADWA